MTKAKVVHVANLDIGYRLHLRNQMIYLRDQGFDQYGVCPKGHFITEDGPTEDGIPVKLINYTASALTPLRDLKALAQLIHYFRKNSFDIVHTHGLKPGLLGRVAARIAGVPIVIHTVHGLFFYEGMSTLQQRFWAQIERLGMSFGDYALSQNRDDVETIVRLGICHPDRIGYLGNGIDQSLFNPRNKDKLAIDKLRREMGVAPGEMVVSIAGRLLVEKGYLDFFEAAKEIRQRRSDVHFWAMGPAHPGRAGSLSSNHPAVAEGAQFVNFLGMRSDMPQVFAATDVFVLPSHGREGVPRVLMEAAATQCPIVATNVRGCTDVVQHEVTGLLVSPRDPQELAGAIRRLLDNRDYAARLGLRAGKLARRCFNENEYFRKLFYCYASLLENKLPELAFVAQ